jgi:hypothetical protein
MGEGPKYLLLYTLCLILGIITGLVRYLKR